MNIDINGLRAFVKIAELGTFHEAADALSISQSALSRRLSRLEKYLEIRLLDRDTHKVRLTILGRNFLPQACRLVDELETSFNNLRKIAKHGVGQVVLACLPSVAMGILPYFIAEYNAKYPHNRIRILDLREEQIPQALLGGEAEFAVTLAGNEATEFETRRLADDPWIAVCHRDHPLAKRKSIKWVQLSRHRLITVGRLGVNRSLMKAGLPSEVLHQSWHYEVRTSFATGLSLAECGNGVLIVPRVAVDTHHRPLLVSRVLTEPVVSRTVVAMMRRAISLSPASRAFLDLLVSRWPAIYRQSKP